MDSPVEFSGTGEARGRNGWFAPIRGEIWRFADDTVELTVFSRQAGKIAPIIVRDNTEAMKAIGQALVDVAEGRKPRA